MHKGETVSMHGPVNGGSEKLHLLLGVQGHITKTINTKLCCISYQENHSYVFSWSQDTSSWSELSTVLFYFC